MPKIEDRNLLSMHWINKSPERGFEANRFFEQQPRPFIERTKGVKKEGAKKI